MKSVREYYDEDYHVAHGEWEDTPWWLRVFEPQRYRYRRTVGCVCGCVQHGWQYASLTERANITLREEFGGNDD